SRFTKAGRFRQHASRVRSPERCVPSLWDFTSYLSRTLSAQKPSRRSRMVTSTITPGLFRKKPHRGSTNSLLNSSVILPTKSWSRFFRKCRATRISPITHSAWHRRGASRSEEHTSELQSPDHLVCRLLLEKKKHR